MTIKPLKRAPLRRAASSFALITFSTIVLAAPNIESTNYDQSNNTLTLFGSGFGNPGFKFALLESVDRTTLSQNEGLTDYNYDTLWDQYGSPWANPLVPRQMSGPFPQASNMVYFGDGKSDNSYIKPVEEQKSRNLYVSWNYRPSMDPNQEGGSNKFIRIWDDHSGTHTRISWTNMHLTYVAKDISGSDDVSWGGWSGNAREWNLLEIFVDSDAGTIEAWTNGKLVHDVKNYVKSTISAGLGVRLLGFDASHPDPYKSMEIHIDNVYVSNTPAKVFLSTQPTWDSSLLSTSATQLPISWSDSEITLSINLDQFTEDSYIYVFDESRLVNQNGYPLGGCSRCPNSPTLTIEQ